MVAVLPGTFVHVTGDARLGVACSVKPIAPLDQLTSRFPTALEMDSVGVIRGLPKPLKAARVC